MKIKNMKLMLLGLLAMGASNASATVGDKIKRANLEFEITAEPAGKTAEVKFLGMVASPAKTDADGAIANQPDGTITIPATTWTMDTKGNKINYNVTAIDANWATYNSATLASSLKKLVSEVVEKNSTGTVISNLTATNFTKLAEVVLPAGQTVLADNAFSGCAALATINLANVVTYGSSALKGTIIPSIDLTNAKEIGASAFEGINTVKTVSIPATVETIGADAFKDMYKAPTFKPGVDADGDPITIFVPAQGLEELTFNANSDATKGFATIPAVFAGDALLKKVTIASTKAADFATKAFVDAVALEELDLTGCTALATINANDFAAAPFKSIKLAGTKIKDIANLDITNANRTLATISLPTTFGKGITATQAFGIVNKFENFIALTELDLSATQVKEIPAGLFAWSEVAGAGPGGTEELQAGGLSYTPAKFIKPALTTVKLNAETAAIGAKAFEGCAALATVVNLNNAKMAAIGFNAFNGTALTALDLSATAVTVIPEYAFGNMSALTSIKLPAGITQIYPAAFANAAKVTSINLQDLKKLSVLNPIFHEGVVNPTWTAAAYSGYIISATANEVAIPITSLTLPADGALTTINPGALQLLDITEIDIPATVISINAYALQGCIGLEKFTWNEAPSRWIFNNTFRGDDHMKEVTMVTTSGGVGITIAGTTSTGDPVDLIFKGNSKDVLTFTVNAEDEAALIANGWTKTNLKFCTLTAEGASEFEFKAAGKAGDFYYATYCKTSQATWFPADKFEVFSAVVEGSDVVLNAASTEGGYYKVKRGEPCIIRSKEQKASYELKNALFNDISTMPTDNELKVATANFTPSRLKYQYKFGAKGGVVAFYRVVSGTIKQDQIYIEAATAADRLNIVFEGDATAINGVATKAAESNGAIYNLNGVRVNKAGKGVYIQNGKKYMMK